MPLVTPLCVRVLVGRGWMTTRNPIYLSKDEKDIKLILFEIRAQCIKRMRLEHSSAARMWCLVCMAHVRLRAWLRGVGIPFRFKTLILFFFQTVNTF